MVSKIQLSLYVLLVTVTVSQAQNPLLPIWTPCTTLGNNCLTCTIRQVCTLVGAINTGCNNPNLPYCNAGQCSATPTENCAPSTPDVVTTPPEEVTSAPEDVTAAPEETPEVTTAPEETPEVTAASEETPEVTAAPEEVPEAPEDA